MVRTIGQKNVLNKKFNHSYVQRKNQRHVFQRLWLFIIFLAHNRFQTSGFRIESPQYEY